MSTGLIFVVYLIPLLAAAVNFGICRGNTRSGLWFYFTGLALWVLLRVTA